MRLYLRLKFPQRDSGGIGFWARRMIRLEANMGNPPKKCRNRRIQKKWNRKYQLVQRVRGRIAKAAGTGMVVFEFDMRGYLRG